MRFISSAILGMAIIVTGQSYPPPFPRPGAVKMLENPRVQVWNVAWPKGQQTALHRHPYDMTGTYYAPGDRLITAVDGSKRPVSTKAGGIIWQRTGLTHIEEGTSDEPLRAVMIELKQDGPEKQVDHSSNVAAFSGDGGTAALDNDRVTVWSYARPLRADTPAHRHARDAVVVWMEGATPHAAYVARGTSHSEEAIGPATRATIFELK
jgi:quercetin dioxygenase-like cupin family protein